MRFLAEILPIISSFILLWVHGCVARKPPEASSTLLQMHRLYIQQPPHDRTLYDTLHVSPNATAADITKAYRKLSRRYHPDKARNDSDSVELLEKVRDAYEVLKDDTTRLPYHRYGISEPTQAVLVLTGRGIDNDPESEELLRLMGYHRAGESPSQQERLLLLATDLVEKLRPVVEGRISKHTFYEIIAAECDQLKKLPLGAQIIRCVGRAYKHAGQRYLRTMKNKAVVPETLRDGFRQSKLLLTAAGWWGRAVVTEGLAARTSNRPVNAITLHGRKGNFGGGLVERHNDVPSEDEFREKERRKAQKAMIESTQVEALWKICKVDLYRTIRQACDLILSGELFFFATHRRDADGWVGSKGEAVNTRLGLYRTAMAMTTMGDIMVERSKEGTAWME